MQTNVGETSDENVTSFKRTKFDNKEVIKTKTAETSNPVEDTQEYNANAAVRNANYNNFINEDTNNGSSHKSKIKTKANSKQQNTQETTQSFRFRDIFHMIQKNPVELQCHIFVLERMISARNILFKDLTLWHAIMRAMY